MKELKTQRLLLRSLTPDDAQAMYAYSKHPLVGKNAGWKPHDSLEETQEIMKTVFLDKENIWGIVLLEEQKLIGTIGLLADEKRQHDRVKMIGYSLAYESWGKGLMTEAVNAVVTYGFSHLDIDLISAYCYPSNDRSQRVLKKCGFMYEGTLQKAEKMYYGEILDHVCFSLKKEKE